MPSTRPSISATTTTMCPHASSTSSSTSSTWSATPTRLWRLDTHPLPDEEFDWSVVDHRRHRDSWERSLALSDRSAHCTRPRTRAPHGLAADPCPRRGARSRARFGGVRTQPAARPSLVWLAGQINGGLFWRGRRSSVVGVEVVWRPELRRTWSQSRPRRRVSTRAARLSQSGAGGWASRPCCTSRYRSVLIRRA